MAGFDQMARQLMAVGGGNEGGNLGGGSGALSTSPRSQTQPSAPAAGGGNDSWMMSPAGILGHIFGSKSQPGAAGSPAPAPRTDVWKPPEVLTPGPQTQPPAPPAPPAPGAPGAPGGAPDPGMGPPPPPVDQTPINSPWGGTMQPGQTLGSIFQALVGAGRPAGGAGPGLPALSGGGTPATGVPLPSVQAGNPFDAIVGRR
jgi:hypothetical protein